MKKRNTVRLTSFLIAGVIVFAGISVRSGIKLKRYRTELEIGYSKNLSDFSSAINNISATLNKARFVTTPAQISSMAAKLLSEAEVSKTALAQLPVASELTALNRFLSQVGNYAMSISKSLILGGAMTENDNQNIEALSDTANRISELIRESQITYDNADYWAAELDNRVEDIIGIPGIADTIDELEGEFSDYPKLIYDGPYSDHILEKEPEMIKNADAVTKEQALKTAAEAARCPEEELSYDGSVSGSIPAYRFRGEGVTVDVSQNGGYTVFMRKERESGKTELSAAQARQKAKRFIEQTGFTGLAETYYFINDGVCTVNFAFIDGETICYTDLIKVGVAMDSGDAVFYEASGYLSNHKSRAFETPAHTLSEAMALIKGGLSVKSTALALIPMNSGKEIRCYEFDCVSKDSQELLIYINTQTLAEEEILILLKSDNGILVK